MKLAKHLAWSLIWAAAVAGCGGGGGGGGAGNADSGGSGGTLTVPVCATSNTSQGWLTDYKNTSNPLAYNQAVQGCVAGAYSTPTLAFPNTSVLLTRDNIRAMIGSPSSTTGTAPTFSFYIQTPAPNLTATRSTIELAITKGTDATRDKGVDSQVMINLNVVTQLENNKLVIRSDGSQIVNVNAFTSGNTTDIPDILNGSNPFQLTFGNDLIATASNTAGGMVLTVNAFGLLTKIYDLAQQNDPDASGLLLGLTVLQYPTAGDYTFSIQKSSGADLPLKTINGDQINKLSIGLPIQ
jgi:hypothetical protein